MKYVSYFNEISKKDLMLAGGKGANLGELFNNGFPVPPGFCITTDAYKLIVKDEKLNELIKKLKNANLRMECGLEITDILFLGI